MIYRAAIFDLDGTVLYTLEDLKISLNYTLAKRGFPERSLDEVRLFVGNGIRKLISRAVPEGTDDDEIDSLYAVFKEHYALHSTDNTYPYPGICELLSALREAGIKTAVVSNKADFAVKILCEKYFGELLDISVGERDGVRRKPAPDALFEVMKHLEVGRGQTVYVGDSDVDIETAKNAGVDVISVDWGFRDRDFLKEHGAEKIVSTSRELMRAILGGNVKI